MEGDSDQEVDKEMKKRRFKFADPFLIRSVWAKGLLGPSRASLQGSLNHIKRLGFRPRTVLDVGAARGTLELYRTFPEAGHILIEPLEENRSRLAKVARRYENVEVILAAATGRGGQVTMNVHPDLMGSSIYLENEDSNVKGFPRIVPAITLDQLWREGRIRNPCLLKVDVQGGELEVLSGSEEVLRVTEYAVLECSLFQFFRGGPQITDIIDDMKARGFSVYDLFGFQYRLLDGAMSQVDIAFVKEDGFFRESHDYATKEQRNLQNRRFVKKRERDKRKGE
jgi:FkbM family methyltransferase